MTEQTQKKSWFSRNWLWFIPVSGCLGLLILFALGIGGALFGANKLFGDEGPYEYAFEQAKTNAEVVAILGEPIEKGDSVQFSFSFDTDENDKVDFTIPIEGSKAEGSIVVKAQKENKTWAYKKLYVEIKDTKEKINLLDKSLEGI